jgi:hypothetical protein
MNDMTNINRRTLIATGGGAVLLGACGSDGKNAADTSQSSANGGAVKFAPCDDYGDSPKKGKSKPPKSPWRPLHSCLIYIHLDGSNLTVRHAYYPTGLTDDIPDVSVDDPSSAKDDALEKLRALVGKPSEPWPAQPVAFAKKGIDFKNLHFGGQQEIYIFMDGSLARLDPDNLVVFGKNPTKPTGPKPKSNKTYYNAQILTAALGVGKDVLYFQNWFHDDQGQPMKPGLDEDGPNYKFKGDPHAMNIHILLGSANIPAVIDPDTGNGTNWRP